MKSKRRVHTSAERKKVIYAYRDLIAEEDRKADQLKATGLREGPWISTAQFAASHHISKSTLYRWLSGERRKVAATPPNLTDVNHSIELLQSADVSVWEFIAAAMNFSAWLVFPNSYYQRCSRTLSLMVSQNSDNEDTRAIDNLPPEISRATRRFITVGLLRRLSDLNDPPLGDHEYYFIDESGYTDRDVLRSVGFRFIEALQKGEAVSINKVGSLLENGRLLDGLFLGPALFASIWRSHASTIPFVCAEKTAGIDWHLEFDPRLDERLEAFLRDRERVRDYFQVARLYVDRFEQALDPRARQRIAIPTL